MIPTIIQYIAAPLIGGVIGYITNDIAIRMLFRPYNAKYIFGFRIPFTPGIIPKEKERIAKAVGDAISQNLMNHEVLERYLLSNQMIEKVRTSIQDFLERQKDNTESVEQFLQHYVSEDELQDIIRDINSNLTSQVHRRLSDTEVGENIARIVVDNVIDKMSAMDPTELLNNILVDVGVFQASAARMFGGGLIANFLSLLREPAERLLARKINNMLQENGAEIISNMIGSEVNQFVNTPLSDILKGKDRQIDQIAGYVENLYVKVITDNLPRILQSIDISKIVTDRINEMDMAQTEQLILQVMKKELRAIVWLGALLGTIMGCINIVL